MRMIYGRASCGSIIAEEEVNGKACHQEKAWEALNRTKPLSGGECTFKSESGLASLGIQHAGDEINGTPKFAFTPKLRATEYFKKFTRKRC